VSCVEDVGVAAGELGGTATRSDGQRVVRCRVKNGRVNLGEGAFAELVQEEEGHDFNKPPSSSARNPTIFTAAAAGFSLEKVVRDFSYASRNVSRGRRRKDRLGLFAHQSPPSRPTTLAGLMRVTCLSWERADMCAVQKAGPVLARRYQHKLFATWTGQDTGRHPNKRRDGSTFASKRTDGNAREALPSAPYTTASSEIGRRACGGCFALS